MQRYGGDTALGLRCSGNTAVDLAEQGFGFGHRRIGADDGDLANFIKGDDGRSLVLRQRCVQLIESGDHLTRGKLHKLERSHGSAASRADRRYIKQRDRLAQLLDPGPNAFGNDRVGALVEGDAEPRHALLGRLDLFPFRIGDVPLDAFAHEGLERLHQILGLGVLDGEDLDGVFRVFAIELLNDQEKSANLGRSLGDHQRVLLLHRGHRAVFCDHHGELLGQRLGHRDVQRENNGDDLVGGNVLRHLSNKQGQCLALHLGQLLEVQHVLGDTQHHAVRLENRVEHFQSLGNRVAFGIQVVQTTIGNVGLLDHRQPGCAREEIDHLIERRALEIEADQRRLVGGRVGGRIGRILGLYSRWRDLVGRAGIVLPGVDSARHGKCQDQTCEHRHGSYTQGHWPHSPLLQEKQEVCLKRRGLRAGWGIVGSTAARPKP